MAAVGDYEHGNGVDDFYEIWSWQDPASIKLRAPDPGQRLEAARRRARVYLSRPREGLEQPQT